MKPTFLVVLALVALAGCLDGTSTLPGGAATPTRSQTPLSGEAPALTPGDHWTMAATSHDVRVTVTSVVLGVVEHGGVRAYALNTRSQAQLRGSDSATNGTTWRRTTDRAQVEVYTETHTSAGGRQQNSTSRVTFTPPCADLRYPLTVGAQWTQHCFAVARVGAQTVPVQTNTTFTVEATEPVSVPAGVFDAYRVRMDSGGGQPAVEWWSSQACGIVRQSSGSGNDAITVALVDYQCQS